MISRLSSCVRECVPAVFLQKRTNCASTKKKENHKKHFCVYDLRICCSLTDEKASSRLCPGCWGNLKSHSNLETFVYPISNPHSTRWVRPSLSTPMSVPWRSRTICCSTTAASGSFPETAWGSVSSAHCSQVNSKIIYPPLSSIFFKGE